MDDMRKSPSKLTEKLVFLSKQKGVTNIEVARAIGVSPQQYGYYLSGAMPGLAALVKLAEFHGVPLEWFADDEAPADKPPRRLEAVSDQELMAEAAKRWTNVFLRLNALIDRAEKIDWESIIQKLRKRDWALTSQAPGGIIMRDQDPHDVVLLYLGVAMECALDTLDSVQVAFKISAKNEGELQQILGANQAENGSVSIDPARQYIANRILALFERAYPGYSQFAPVLALANMNLSTRVYVASDELDKLDQALQACGV